MNARKLSQLPPEPPPAIMAVLRDRLSERELQVYGALFAFRKSAQQMDNTVTDWMSDSAATPARFQILMLLLAGKRRGVPHKDIVTALGVTRATISGLMAGLERDGLVTSVVADDDRRNLLANLTPKGEAVIEKAFETNRVRLRTAFAVLSPADLTTLTVLLERLRQGFLTNAVDVRRDDGGRDRKTRRTTPIESRRRRA